MVLAAVTEYGGALQYASEELQNDKEVVMAAVTQSGHSLQYSSEELKNDKEVVLAAVTRNGNGWMMHPKLYKTIMKWFRLHLRNRS